MYAKDFRALARQALAGRWGVAVGTGLVAMLLGGAIGSSADSGSSSVTDMVTDPDKYSTENAVSA